MKEETKVELAKLAMQLTIALIQDGKGHLNDFKKSNGGQFDDGPLEVFDKIHDHLTGKISKE